MSCKGAILLLFVKTQKKEKISLCIYLPLGYFCHLARLQQHGFSFHQEKKERTHNMVISGKLNLVQEKLFLSHFQVFS